MGFSTPTRAVFGGILLDNRRASDVSQSFTSTPSKVTAFSSPGSGAGVSNMISDRTGDLGVQGSYGTDSVLLRSGAFLVDMSIAGMASGAAGTYEFHLRLDGAELSPDLGCRVIVEAGGGFSAQINGIVAVPVRQDGDGIQRSLSIYGELVSGVGSALFIDTCQLRVIRADP